MDEGLSNAAVWELARARQTARPTGSGVWGQGITRVLHRQQLQAGQPAVPMPPPTRRTFKRRRFLDWQTHHVRRQAKDRQAAVAADPRTEKLRQLAAGADAAMVAGDCEAALAGVERALEKLGPSGLEEVPARKKIRKALLDLRALVCARQVVHAEAAEAAQQQELLAEKQRARNASKPFKQCIYIYSAEEVAEREEGGELGPPNCEGVPSFGLPGGR